MEVFSILEWKQSFSNLYVCVADLCWRNSTVSHMVVVTKAWDIRGSNSCSDTKNSSSSIQQQKKLSGTYLFFPTWTRNIFSLIFCPPKATEQTWYISKSSHFDKTLYYLETPVQWSFSDYSTQSSLECLKDTMRPMPFSKVLPLSMDFK